MAKADDMTSTDWIWLREALVLAIMTLGSMELAKDRITQWLADGKLPWFCLKWKGLDAEGVAKVKQRLDAGGNKLLPPSGAYYNGDPQFWGGNLLNIDWEDNAASESPFVADGAHAWEIKVPRARLLELLPGGPRNKKPKKPGRQERRVLPVLKTLYPPDGKVPDDVPTEVVRGQVNKELSADSRNRELAAPSWDTIKRALGRS